MSILARLWRYVHTNGYPLPSSPAFVPAAASTRRRGRGHTVSPRIEYMEQRILMTTLLGGERFTYTDARGNTILTQINGSALATELIAATQDGNGALLFGDIEGTIRKNGDPTAPVDPRNGEVVGNGAIPVSGGLQGTATLGFGQGFGSSIPFARNFGGIAANSGGSTFGFNITSNNQNGKPLTTFPVTGDPIPTSAPSGGTLPPVPYDLMLFQINTNAGPAAGNAFNFQDLTIVLEGPDDDITGGATGAAALEPDLLAATKVSIAGAAFNPADGLLYFDLQFTPKPPQGGGTIPQQDVLYSVDPSAGPAVNENPATTTVRRIGNLDNEGGVYTISALAFTSTGTGTSTLYTYRLPANTANVTPTPEPNLETYDAAAGTVNLAPVNDSNVEFGYHPQAATITYLTGVTGLAALPASFPGAQGDFLFATIATDLVRIDLTNLPSNTDLTSFVYGSTTDEVEVNQNPPRPPFDGNSLIGLTFNPNVVDPFNGTRGVLESYDNANSTQDTVFVNDRLRILDGDVFAVYTNQADITDSITFQSVTLNAAGAVTAAKAYTGNIGTINTTANNANLTAPTSGGGLLGFIGTVPNLNAATPITNQLFLSGLLESSLGIMPATFSTLVAGTPTSSIFAGLTVGYGLEQTLNAGAFTIDQVLGDNFTSATGLALSRGGLTAVINSTASSADQFAFVNKANGKISSNVVTVTDANGNALFNNQGIAYGSVNLDGNESIYAVYDIDFGDGNGPTPTLGVITPTFNNGTLVAAVFNPVGTAGLGLGLHAKVEGIAFGPGGSAFDSAHQALYIIADPDATDDDPTGTLYQVDPTTGTIVDTNGIGPVVSQDGNQVLVGSATFNAAGQLLVLDRQSGRLLDVNLSSGVAGVNISSQPGTINPTVGAISVDPITGQLYAIDNETTLGGDGSQLAVGGNPLTGSSILMKIRNPSVLTNSDVSLGKFFFDGTVTGRVFVTGSMNTFYAGWLVTGDAGDGSTYNQQIPGFGGVFNETADPTLATQNFFVGGDLGNLLTLASIGTNGVPAPGSGLPGYITQFDLLVNGKLGNLNTDGMFSGHTVVQDNTGIPNAPDNGLPEASIQQEVQYYEIAPTAPRVANDFAQGLLVDNGVAPFSDTTFNTAQYLGTVRNQVLGQPDVVSLDGELFGLNANGTPGPDASDYYAISLLAGQSVQIQVTTFLEDVANFGVATRFGIFDPEGRLIASDFTDIDPTAVNNQPIRITATEAGVYRIAVAEPGDPTFVTPGTTLTAFTTTGNLEGGPRYHLTVTGLGDMAIGGFVAGGSIILEGNPTQPNFGNSIEAVRGDVGAIVAGQGRTGTANGDAILAPESFGFGAFSEPGNTSTASETPIGTPSEDLAVDRGSLRAVVAPSIGRQIGLNNGNSFSTVELFPDIFVPNGTVGLIQATGTGTNDVLVATFGVAAGGNIQHIEAAADLGGYFRTNKGFGVIEAANMTLGSDETEFHANVDGTGSDGIIDLISTPGAFGQLGDGGPAIITGPGGNVRFIHVGGDLFPDLAFGGGGTGSTPEGFVQQAAGTITLTDDSGSKVTLTAGPIQTSTTTIDPTTGLVVTDPTTGLPAVTTSSVPNPVGIRTRVYGIRGSGGVVILNVVSTSGLTVNATTSGSAVGSAEIGEIQVGSLAAPVITSNATVAANQTIVASAPAGQQLVLLPSGAPALPTPPVPVANQTVTPLPQSLDVTLTGGHVDVYNVTNGGTAGVTIDNITNNTGGDILNVTAGDVGNIIDSGNVGSTTSTTGQAVAAVSNVIAGGNAFPFNNQHVGLTTGSIVSISAGKSIGNIIASGAIGTITADTLGNVNPALFYGINGPILAQGGNLPQPTTIISPTNPFPNLTANGTVTTGTVETITNANGTITTVTPNADGTFTVTTSATINAPAIGGSLPTSIFKVNIGNGILSSGTGSFSNAGLYATDGIAVVTGANADIRGNIVSSLFIGNITLTNGSIIDANIEVLTNLAGSLEIGTVATTLPTQTPISAAKPFFELGSITLNGDGGIIGANIAANDIGKITVNAGGFGILNSFISTSGDGVIDTLTAAGYGFRNDSIVTLNLNGLVATGNGSQIPFAAFDPGVQASQVTDGSFAASNSQSPPNPLNDLEMFILGDAPAFQPASPSGATSGVIEDINATGSGTVGDITAFTLVGSNIAFANGTGAITITSNIIPYIIQAPNVTVVPNNTILTADGTAITTGTLKSLTVGGSAIELDLSVAGKTGPIVIDGNLSPYVNPLAVINGNSEIFIKGPSGDVSSINVFGNVSTGATILVQGVAGSIVIGSANKTGVSTGDFSGNLIIQGDHPAPNVLNLLEIFGSILGGNFDIIGNVGTINVAHSLTSDFVVQGNLGSLIVGSDPFHSGDVLGGTFTVEGNAGNISVTGAAIGTVLVEGNAGNISLFSDGVSPNLVAIGAQIDAQGTIGSFTVSGGNVAGLVDAGKTFTKGTIIGSILQGGSVTSSLGSIGSLSISGGVAGSITAPNGNIGVLAVSGNVGFGANVTANSLTSISASSFGGNLTITNGLSNATFGTIAFGAVISANWIGGIRTAGDSLGNISSSIASASTAKGAAAKGTLLTIGGSLGGIDSFGAPLTVTVGGNINPGAQLSEAGTLTNLQVGGAIEGDVIVGGQITALTAGAAAGAVITSGFGMTKVTIKGAVTSSIIQAGLAPGNDGIFGTADLGEQSRMADITTLTVGALTASVVAAGGNIGTFKSGSTMLNSSVSSGLVLGGANIEAVINGTTPLTSGANLAALRMGSTLYAGNFTTATVGGSGLVSSALTAGVSPGADGVFNPAGTGDDSVSTSLTGGTSAFRSVKAHADGASAILAASGGSTSSVVAYTLANGVANSITGNDSLGTLSAVAGVGTPIIYSDGLGNTLSISIVGAKGSTVSVFGTGDNPNIVITGVAGKPVSVSITSSLPGGLNLGRVLTTDGTQVANFVTNAYLVGDGDDTVPQLWIDSAMTAFTAAGFATNGSTNNAAWSGQIGGSVKSFTVGVQGPGTLRIGGQIATLNVGSSTGNPLLKQLGTSPIAGITNLATNSAGVTYAYSGGFVFPVDPTTGAVLGGGVPVHTATGASVNITGMDFNTGGALFGVGSVNDQAPTVASSGKISIGDQLHALAINPTNGLAYAINTDVVTGNDELMSIDPTTGAGTIIGELRDAFNNSFTHNVLAIAFTSDGTLYGIVNDRDGNGPNSSPANGDVFVQIAVGDPNDTGAIRVSNPSPNGSALAGVFITTSGNPVTGNYTGLVADPANPGSFLATRIVGGVTVLDRLTLTVGNTPAATTVTAAPIDVVTVNGANTNIVGIGFDENYNLIGLDENAGSGDLVNIVVSGPSTSQYLTAPSTIPNNLAGFAVATTGTIRQTFAYTTDPNVGGTFFTNPGVVSTLGSIDLTTGLFAERGALTQDAAGTPLAGTVTSVAINKATGNVTVLTSNGVIAQYGAFNAFLFGNPQQPLGTVVDAITHQALDITHITYDATGRLIGIDATNHRLDAISLTPTQLVINGQSVTSLLATALTEVGTANAADLGAFDFDASNNTFLAFDSTTTSFVSLLGINDGALGGIIAPSIVNLNIGSGNYAGRINATGVGIGNSINTIKALAPGLFLGDIVTAGSIGAFTRTGEFNGTVIADGNFQAAVIAGDVLADGTLFTGGTLGAATVTGTLLGSLLANNATAITVGNVGIGGDINVTHNLTGLTISGFDAGTVTASAVTTFVDSGPLLAGSNATITGDAGSVFLNGGAALGSSFLVDGNVTKTFVVGGTLSGTVGARLNVASATLTNLVVGLFDVGGDLTALNVVGSTVDSLIAAGTWVGFDGKYNTDDDIIYGGSIGSAKFAGQFTDSAISAGVLPSESAVPGPANNIPLDNHAFSGNAAASNVSQANSMQSGGIALSNIGTLTFSSGVVSSNTGAQAVSVAVAANGLGTVVNGVNLVQDAINTPAGALQVGKDPVTNAFLVTRVSNTQIVVAFTKPIDTSTINADNITVLNTANGLPVTGVTYAYSVGTASDGITKEYLVSIIDTNSFPTTVTLIIRNLSDNFGSRTSLLDFNQDGVSTTNPFSPAPAEPLVDTQI